MPDEQINISVDEPINQPISETEFNRSLVFIYMTQTMSNNLSEKLRGLDITVNVENDIVSIANESDVREFIYAVENEGRGLSSTFCQDGTFLDAYMAFQESSNKLEFRSGNVDLDQKLTQLESYDFFSLESRSFLKNLKDLKVLRGCVFDELEKALYLERNLLHNSFYEDPDLVKSLVVQQVIFEEIKNKIRAVKENNNNALSEEEKLLKQRLVRTIKTIKEIMLCLTNQ